MKTNNKNGFHERTVHNLIILDESGSMESIRHATIAGFNEVVQTIQGVERQFPEQKHFVTLVTFNSLGIKTRLFMEKPGALRELDSGSFEPDAMTPLYDAIGQSVTNLRRKTDQKNNCSVLVTILTDGMENDSKEYSGAAVRRLIKEMKRKGWTFTYIGANHAVEEAAFELAIVNSLHFEATEADVKRAFDEDKKSRIEYAMSLSRNEDVQQEYFEKGRRRDKPEE